MSVLRARAIPAVCLAVLFCSTSGRKAWAQNAQETPALSPAPLSSLNLTADKVSHLRTSVAAHDYVAAESLLIQEIEKAPHAAESAPLLAYLGSIYFLNHDFLNAAVAWKKSGAIAPLNAQLRFSLAMAYIRIAHPDWAEKELRALAANDARNALYPYWLGRLDYDAHLYSEAAAHFRQAIALDAAMSRAYDNLGLCLFYQNDNTQAIENFSRAIALDKTSGHPSPWPYVNLAITQEFLGQTTQAESNLREAIRIAPLLANAHYQLGVVLDDEEKPEDAIKELQEAARLDETYAEPHISLAHVYRKIGHKDAAKQEAAIYARLHAKPQSTASTP